MLCFQKNEINKKKIERFLSSNEETIKSFKSNQYIPTNLPTMAAVSTMTIASIKFTPMSDSLLKKLDMSKLSEEDRFKAEVAHYYRVTYPLEVKAGRESALKEAALKKKIKEDEKALEKTVPEGHIVCTKCKKAKVADVFNKSNKNGVVSVMKTCDMCRERALVNFSAKKSKVETVEEVEEPKVETVEEPEHTCVKCEKTKPEESFKNNKGVVMKKCAECRKASPKKKTDAKKQPKNTVVDEIIANEN